jgi:hypothetical protein
MSEILVNKLTGTSTAGSILVTGEGNSTTTNLQQGLVKHWTQITQASATVRDSFNQSSATDEGTGDTSWDFVNGMGNSDYSSQCTSTSNAYHFTSSFGTGAKTAAGDRAYTMTAGSTTADSDSIFITTSGDLA